MALDDSTFKTEIKSLMDDMKDRVNYEEAKEAYAENLMQAVKNYIKSGTVNVTVSTSGTATSHTGTGTGAIT